MKGWNAVAKVDAAPSLVDVMNQQHKEKLAARNDSNDDFLYALKLQEELSSLEIEANMAPNLSDDELIAQMLQEEENESNMEPSRPMIAKDTAVYSKIQVQRSEYPLPPHIKNPAASVHSSSYAAALQLERKMELNHSNTSNASKHEPLLRALRTSDHLTEIDGGGDFQGLLVDRNVGRPLEEFAKKQRKIRNRKGNNSNNNVRPTARLL